MANDAESYIEQIPKFTSKNDPGHTRELLRRLGDPQKKFRVVHVAGTNGKGSVCAYLSSIFVQAGIRTGLFISPHLVEMRERFQIDGEEISAEVFAEAFTEVRQMAEIAVRDGLSHPTYFEFLFLMGMLIFSQKKVGLAVLETGLGGRLDATNVIDDPLVDVITSISLDHTEILGDTVEKIAAEKAGIIKPQVPTVYDATNETAATVIARAVDQSGSYGVPVTRADMKILQNTTKGIDFLLHSGYYENKTFHIPYIAEYQVENAALALRAVEVLQKEVKTGDLGRAFSAIDTVLLQKAFAEVRWPGRMEMVLPGVVLDGAHNEDGVAGFLQTVSHFQKTFRMQLLFSAVVEKNVEAMVAEICREVCWEHVYVTQLLTNRAVPAERLAALFRQNGCTRVSVISEAAAAFRFACDHRGDALLFCVGSLYLVGEIKQALQSKTDG